jgi:glutamate racemase
MTKVGVFDSGIGGLTVVKSLLEHQVFEEIVYFGDTARVPYGSKDKNTIVRYAIEAVEFFKNFELDLIIVACNTVSAYALEEMRDNSTCPVIGVVEAGILATRNTLKDKNSNILILGTKATINSKAYEIGLNKIGYKNLDSIATGLFVPLVEEELYSGEILKATMKHYFKDLTFPHAIILGCTHFPLISNAINNYFNNKATLIHSGNAIVEHLEYKFNLSKKFKKTKLKFFASENPQALKNVAAKWLKLKGNI